MKLLEVLFVLSLTLLLLLLFFSLSLSAYQGCDTKDVSSRVMYGDPVIRCYWLIGIS